jgi:type II secretory pathway pseudopilin PulG
MIELIFVIVIIGILAAVAIPKLAATRDDAKTSKAVANLATCISDMASSYTATGTLDTSTPACNAVSTDQCWSITKNSTGDGNVTISNGSATGTWCTEARKIASAQDLNGTKVFGGSKVVR